jgi:hypothetical protein
VPGLKCQTCLRLYTLIIHQAPRAARQVQNWQGKGESGRGVGESARTTAFSELVCLEARSLKWRFPRENVTLLGFKNGYMYSEIALSGGGDTHAHLIQLGARLLRFRSLRMALNQRAQFMRPSIALAQCDQRKSFVQL